MAKGPPPEGAGPKAFGAAVIQNLKIYSGLGVMEFFNRLLGILEGYEPINHDVSLDNVAVFLAQVDERGKWVLGTIGSG